MEGEDDGRRVFSAVSLQGVEELSLGGDRGAIAATVEVAGASLRIAPGVFGCNGVLLCLDHVRKGDCSFS